MSQPDEIEGISQKWLGFALSSEPTNEDRGTAAIRRLFVLVGLAEPKVFWFDSPFGALSCILSLRQMQGRPFFAKDEISDVTAAYTRSLTELIGVEQFQALLKSVDNEILSPACEKIADQLWVRAAIPAEVSSANDGIASTLASAVKHEAADYIKAELFEHTISLVVDRVLRDVGARLGSRMSVKISETVSTQILQWVSKLPLHLQSNTLRELTERMVRTRGPIRQHLQSSLSTVIRGHLNNQFYFFSRSPQITESMISALTLHDLLPSSEILPAADAVILEGFPKDVHWMWPFQGVCFASRKPVSAFLDDRQNLHSNEGPAVKYRDEWSLWCWHGVLVPERAICRPEEISLELIAAERNIEVRRVLIERYGTGRFVIDSGGKLIHQDKFGTLYQRNEPGEIPILIVRVVNATPEPDGTFKEYFLRVPTGIRTAKEAVAWTFGLPVDQYNPKRET